jgi:hypothetical protein
MSSSGPALMNPSGGGRRRPHDDGGGDREGGGEGADAARRSAGRKSQRSSSSNRDSPSAVANNRNGFESAISILRSVLHHKLGLPLTLYLHGGDDNSLYDTLGEWFPELLVDPPPIDAADPPLHAADPPDPPAPPQPPQPPQLQLQPQPLPVLQHFARPLNTAFDEIMEQSCRAWLDEANRNRAEPNERPLTDLYTTALKVELAQQPDHHLTADHDAEVDLGDGTWGRPDVMVRNASTGHPVLVIEVGTSSDFWWKKVDQCLKYAVGLYDVQGEFTHPVLVTVLTVECETKEKEDAKEEEEADPHKAAEEGVNHGVVYAEDEGEEDDDDELHQPCSVGAVLIAQVEKEEGKTSKVKEKIEIFEESVTEEEEEEEEEELEDDDVEDDDKDDEDYEYEVDHDDDEIENAEFVFATARIGTFLITSRKERPTSLNDFRLALLRRIETSDVNVLSTELGRVVRAACLLSAWTSGRPLIDHDYLGPNCRRVGEKVNVPTVRVSDGLPPQK